MNGCMLVLLSQQKNSAITISPPSTQCLKCIPKLSNVNFYFKKDIEAGFRAVDALVFLPSGGDVALAEIWPEIKATCKWVHRLEDVLVFVQVQNVGAALLPRTSTFVSLR